MKSETKSIAFDKVKLFKTSLGVGFLCFSSCFYETKGFSIPSTTSYNQIRRIFQQDDFMPTVASMTRRCNRQRMRMHVAPVDIDFASLANPVTTSSFYLSAVEVFDGSSIVDPVVVSSSFWSGLQRQVLSVILGQFIASVVFAILVSFLAPQLSALRDTIVSKFTNGNNSDTATKKFIKADSIVRPEPDFGKLLICLLIDIIGTSSEALPIIGEATDVVTAPVAAFALQKLFPGSSNFVFLFEFAEEILPLTDFIPFATICWVVDTYYPESSVADVFQLGNYNSAAVTISDRADSLDTTGERINENLNDTNKR